WVNESSFDPIPVFKCTKTVSHRGHREHREIIMSSVPSVCSVAIHPRENRCIPGEQYYEAMAEAQTAFRVYLSAAASYCNAALFNASRLSITTGLAPIFPLPKRVSTSPGGH